jgi:hypothetical protein
MSINVNVPPVEDEQAALTLMFYHLALAAAYFEATPRDIKYEDVPDTFSRNVMWGWLGAMDALYPGDDD